jgi:hypothetical protein
MAKEVNIDTTKILHSEPKKTKDNYGLDDLLKDNESTKTYEKVTALKKNENKKDKEINHNSNENVEKAKPIEEPIKHLEPSKNTESSNKTEMVEDNKDEFTIPGYVHKKEEPVFAKKTENGEPIETKGPKIVETLDDEIKNLVAENIMKKGDDISFFAGTMKKPHVEIRKAENNFTNENSEFVKTKDTKENSYKERINELETIVKSIKKEVDNKNEPVINDENMVIRKPKRDENLKNDKLEETVLIETNLKNLSTTEYRSKFETSVGQQTSY